MEYALTATGICVGMLLQFPRRPWCGVVGFGSVPHEGWEQRVYKGGSPSFFPFLYVCRCIHFVVLFEVSCIRSWGMGGSVFLPTLVGGLSLQFSLLTCVGLEVR